MGFTGWFSVSLVWCSALPPGFCDTCSCTAADQSILVSRQAASGCCNAAAVAADVVLGKAFLKIVVWKRHLCAVAGALQRPSQAGYRYSVVIAFAEARVNKHA